jgi:hypothetical protein
MQPTTAEQLVDELVKGMDKIMQETKPALDKLEADLLKGMADFGADKTDVESVREWLRPMIDAEVRRGIFTQITKNL